MDNIFYIKYLPCAIINGEFVEQRGQVARFDSYKSWVNSNENSHHHRPHLHIEFQNKTYVCSIDNKIEIMEPQNVKGSIKNYIVNAVVSNLRLSREKWNSIISNYKFKDEELFLSSFNVDYIDNTAIITIK